MPFMMSVDFKFLEIGASLKRTENICCQRAVSGPSTSTKVDAVHDTACADFLEPLVFRKMKRFGEIANDCRRSVHETRVNRRKLERDIHQSVNEHVALTRNH